MVKYYQKYKGIFCHSNLRVPNTLSCLDVMAKFRYTRDELELLILKQLENLDALGERVKLLEKQNELLVKMNHKLAEQLSSEKKQIKPYPKRQIKL